MEQQGGTMCICELKHRTWQGEKGKEEKRSGNKVQSKVSEQAR